MTADYTNPNAAAWWTDPAVVGNPLAVGAFCPTCGQRLNNNDKTETCPMGCKGEK